MAVTSPADLAGKPHPRLFGTFPRVLGHYVRERRLLDLPEAIRKMTSAACERFSAVLDPLDIVAEHDQPLDDLVDRSRRVEMGLQPGERGLHSVPRTGEGMSSGTNP